MSPKTSRSIRVAKRRESAIRKFHCIEKCGYSKGNADYNIPQVDYTYNNLSS